MKKSKKLVTFLAAVALSVTACTSDSMIDQAQPMSIDQIAEEYVKLVLAMGLHDKDYVDAYLGPEEWKTEADERALEVAEIRSRAEGLTVELVSSSLGTEVDDAELAARRHRALVRSFESLIARTRMLAGETLTFDEESLALYDATAPLKTAAEFEEILETLDSRLPGEGSVTDRLTEFRKAFIIPPDKLDTVFSAAIEACRERTRPYIDLPEGENFVVEYVTDKSWSGYNWYQGKYQSLIQVNTDLPIYIDRAIDLACHEGYPGHHVYNLLIERELVEKRGWAEFLVYPLFSPRSLIAEGTANYGIEVAFPGKERVRFEREELFPLAGLDPERAEEYYEIQELLTGLAHAGNQAARGYLDGAMTAEEAVDWMMNYSLSSRERAEQRLRFIEQYRSYVINYNLGQDLVREYIERQGGTADEPERRWEVFTELLSEPFLPSDL